MEKHKKHYLIQYVKNKYIEDEDFEYTKKINKIKVGYFSDKELATFCKNKKKLKITYLG